MKFSACSKVCADADVLFKHRCIAKKRAYKYTSSVREGNSSSDLLWCTFSWFLLLIILSSPLKAPDATNKMFVVSTDTLSPRTLRELRSGTLTIVPSRIFNKPWITKEDKKKNTAEGSENQVPIQKRANTIHSLHWALISPSKRIGEGQTLEPYELVWHQIFLFPLSTDAVPQFLQKLNHNDYSSHWSVWTG